ncbi:MAG: hypothetical protein HOP17_16835 [Acidobacteria bacterium]|nr:hypothetical protein [Acidobacteriota bacterium]
MFGIFGKETLKSNSPVIILDVHTTSPGQNGPVIVRKQPNNPFDTSAELFERARRIFERGRSQSVRTA